MTYKKEMKVLDWILRNILFDTSSESTKIISVVLKQTGTPGFFAPLLKAETMALYSINNPLLH